MTFVEKHEAIFRISWTMMTIDFSVIILCLRRGFFKFALKLIWSMPGNVWDVLTSGLIIATARLLARLTH